MHKLVRPVSLDPSEAATNTTSPRVVRTTDIRLGTLDEVEWLFGERYTYRGYRD
jgi:hypothetical protein